MSTVARYALVRIASACLTLFGVAVLIFGAIHALPGSFEDVLVPQAPQELRDQIAARYGLDRPIVEQFGMWLGRAIQGDLGVSLITQQSVAAEFARRLPVTVEVAGIATGIALLVGVPLGVLSGLTGHRRLVPAASRLVGGFAMSVPDFVVGAVLLYVFSRYSLWFTIGNWVSLTDDPIANLRGALLPAFALSLLGIGLIMATARHATISVLGQDFIMAAVARGKRPGRVVRQHVLRNAGIPVITIVAIYSGYLLGGTIIVEMLFSVPGIGRFLIFGVLNRDYTVVQAGVMVAATFFIILNTLADVLYAALDPRLAGSQRR